MRIAECTYNTAVAGREKRAWDGEEEDDDGEDDERLGIEEQKVLDRIGEALARLGRVKRVGLGVKEKMDYVKVWTRKRR